jgi:hypothetical protein
MTFPAFLALVATFPIFVLETIDLPKNAPKRDVPIAIRVSVVVALACASSFSNLSYKDSSFFSNLSSCFSNFSCSFSTSSSIASFNLSCNLILKSSKLSSCFEISFYK